MRIYLSFVLLFLGLSAKSQFNIGLRVLPHSMIIHDVQELRSSTTIFVYRSIDTPYLEALMDTLDQVWTLSPIEFVPYAEFRGKEYGDEYSFLELSYSCIHGLERPQYLDAWDWDVDINQFQYFSLKLWKWKKKKAIHYANFRLFPPDLARNREGYRYIDPCNESAVYSFLYQEADIYNWSPGYLKMCLKYADHQLNHLFERDSLDQPAPNQLAALRRDTLFIPEYCLEKVGRHLRVEYEPQNPKKLMSPYPHPFKVISREELSDKLFHATQPVYFLDYMIYNNRRTVSVLNGLNGDALYYDSDDGSLNLAKGDIRRLARKIKWTGDGP